MAAPNRFDPLASARTGNDPEFDLLLTGSVFFDIIFTGLEALPTPGTEAWAEGMGSCPGGVAACGPAGVRQPVRFAVGSGGGRFPRSTRLGRHRRLVAAGECRARRRAEAVAAALRLPGGHRVERSSVSGAARERHHCDAIGRVRGLPIRPFASRHW